MQKKDLLKEITVDNIDSRLPIIKELLNPKKSYNLKENKSIRSVEISNRLNGHLTWIARELALNRNYVYFQVLLKATEITVDGGSPYPFVIIPRKILNPISMKLETLDLPVPLRTSQRSTRELITACEAAQLYWAEVGNGGCLPERYDSYGRVES